MLSFNNQDYWQAIVLYELSAVTKKRIVNLECDLLVLGSENLSEIQNFFDPTRHWPS